MSLRPVLRACVAAIIAALTAVALATLIGAAGSASADPASIQTVAGTAALHAIACQDVQDCVAVGDDAGGDPVVVTITDGQAATPSAIPGAAGVTMRGIACGSAGHCVAVGGGPDAGYLVPVDDGNPGTPLPYPDTFDLRSVACPTASLCLVGGKANSPVLVAVATDVVGGHTILAPGPVQIPTGAPAIGEGIISVSALACATTTTCYGVFAGLGTGGGGVFPIVDGSAGAVTTYPDYDIGIACPTATTCYAAGAAMHVITGGVPQTKPGGAANETHAVACTTPAGCVAVGTLGEDVAGFGAPIAGGGFGPVQDIGGTTGLDGLACPSSTRCYAVGEEGSGGVLATLIPATTTSPDDASVAVGSDAGFSVTPAGAPTPTVQWQRSDDGGATFSNVGGANAASYTLPDTTLGETGLRFRAVVSNAAGQVTSDAAVLTVTGSAPAITSADHTTFTAGQSGGQFGVTTTGIPDATITESGALPAGVTLTDNGDGTATLAGTAAAAASYPFTLTASNGIAPDATQNFMLTIAGASTTTALSADVGTVAIGNPVQLTATVTPTAPNAAAPGDVVAFFDGATPLGSTALDPDGTAVLTTSTLPAGSRSLTAVYGGDQTFAGSTSPPITVQITQSPAITSDAAAAFTAGVAATFTVTTTGTPAPAVSESGALPDGVAFTDNGDGTATLAGTPAAGSAAGYPLTITATNGTAPDATQSFTLTVEPASTSTMLVAAPAAITVGDSVSLTATVVAVDQNALAPAGSVEFFDGTTSLGTAPLTGATAVLSTSELAVGDRSLTATYSGDPDFAGSISPATGVTVAGIAPAITSADAAAFTIGVAGTFTLTTTGNPAATLTESGGLPDGVTFTDNGDGTATLAGTPAAGSAAGYPLTITATNGTAPDATQAFTLTIADAAVSSTLTASPAPVTAGHELTLVATVEAGAANAAKPSGSVEFFDGSTSLGTATLVGDPTATVHVVTLAVGTHSLTAVYAGDASFAASTSPPISVTVVAAAAPPTSTPPTTGPPASTPPTVATADTGAPAAPLAELAGLVLVIGLAMLGFGRRPRRRGAHRV